MLSGKLPRKLKYEHSVRDAMTPLKIMIFCALLVLSIQVVSAADSVGWVDNIRVDGVATGWAVDPDFTGSINVHFYVDGPAGSGTFAGALLATEDSPDVLDAGWGNSHNRFSFQIPSQYHDAREHTLYAYAIGTDASGSPNGENPELLGSPKAFFILPRCTSFIYSAWTACAFGQQTRTLQNIVPMPCRYDPSELVLSQTCTAPLGHQCNVNSQCSSQYCGPSHLCEMPPVNPSNLPTISSFTVSPATLTQGEPLTVQGSASAGASCITAHRFYVPGSQGGIWTNVSCLQSVSLNDVVPTAQNERSFYRGPGSYQVRWEIANSQGDVVFQERTIQLNSPTNQGSTLPTINSYTITPSTVTEGDQFTVQGSASAGSSCITAHRFFVVGSQGGVWTNVSCVQSVSLNDVVPTDQNPRSFYQGAGSYTLRWEVQNALGQSVLQDRSFLVNAADDGNNGGNNGGNPSDTTPPAPVSSPSTGAINATSITWIWVNPSDSDFRDVLLYLNNVNVLNTTANSAISNGLAPNTNYTLTIYTRDTSGNINPAGVSITAQTLPGAAPGNSTNSTTTPPTNSSTGGSSGSGGSGGGSRRGTTSIVQDPSDIVAATAGTSDPIYISSDDEDADSDSSSSRRSIFAELPSLFKSPVFLMLVLLGVLLLAALIGLMQLAPASSSKPSRYSRVYEE